MPFNISSCLLAARPPYRYIRCMTDILALFMCLGLGELVLIILVTIIIVLFAVHRKNR